MTAKRSRSATEAAKGKPTCLAAFAFTSSHEIAGAESMFVDYRIACGSCGNDRFQILSRPKLVRKPSSYFGLRPGSTLLRPPHELRCIHCGMAEVVFDPRAHGYDGAHGHASSYECSDVEAQAAPGVYQVTVSLGFNIDWEELTELAEKAHVSPCDLFDVLWLRGEPVEGGRPLELDYECA